MKEKQENEPQDRQRRPAWKLLVIVAAVLAVVQACLTIRGRGIEGFILWVIILFAGYWLLFTVLIWLWGKYKDRS